MCVVEIIIIMSWILWFFKCFTIMFIHIINIYIIYEYLFNHNLLSLSLFLLLSSYPPKIKHNPSVNKFSTPVAVCFMFLLPQNYNVNIFLCCFISFTIASAFAIEHKLTINAIVSILSSETINYYSMFP